MARQLSCIAVGLALAAPIGASAQEAPPAGPRLGPPRDASPPAKAPVDVAETLKGPPPDRLRITALAGISSRQGTGNVAFGGRAAYALAPALDVELVGAYVLDGVWEDPALTNLQIRRGWDDERVQRETELLWTLGVGLWWRPIFGAMAAGETVLGRFRVDIGVGVALGETRVPCVNGLDLDPNRGFPTNPQGETVCNPGNVELTGPNPTYYEPNTLRPMGFFGAGLELLLVERLSVRVEVRDYVFVSRIYRPQDEPELGDAVVHRLFGQLGFGVVL